MTVRERLDVILVKKGLAPSRETAKAIIMSGNVYVNGQKSIKAGVNVKDEDVIEVMSKSLKYVSRGGLKLEKALEAFSISFDDKVCSDIGASTGGFTDCMLQNGAKKVFAIDVGYGQLDWKLRNDERVVVLEKTNARSIDLDRLGEKCDFAAIDVSFISLSKILPSLTKTDEGTGILIENGEAVCLIKPQFECGRKYVGKKGVVKDRAVHEYVINKVIEYGAENKLCADALTYSPIKGPNGNIEYLIHFLAGHGKPAIASGFVEEIVNEASAAL